MAFAVTNTFTSGQTLTHTDLNTNFDDIENKLNGGLDTTSLTSSAGITNAQLQNSLYEFVISTTIRQDAALGGGNFLNTATSGFHVIGGVPYDSTDGNTGYTILGVESFLYLNPANTPSTAAVFSLLYGNHTDGFTSYHAAITTGTANGQTQYTVSPTTITTSSARPKFFVLDVTTQGVAFGLGDSWSISIKLKRTNGLRA